MTDKIKCKLFVFLVVPEITVHLESNETLTSVDYHVFSKSTYK